MQEDITAHQQPVAQCVQDVEAFLKQYGERINPDSAAKLADGKDNLRQRYDVVLTQGYDRQNSLRPALEDLAKFETDAAGFEDWLGEARLALDELVDNVGTDQGALKAQLDELRVFVDDLNDQKGDLKFINTSSQKFADQSQVRRLGVDSYQVARW